MEVRHINRSSSATRQPKVDTSTNMLCFRSPNDLYVVVDLAQCVIFASFDSFAGPPSIAGARRPPRLVVRVSRSTSISVTRTEIAGAPAQNPTDPEKPGTSALHDGQAAE